MNALPPDKQSHLDLSAPIVVLCHELINRLSAMRDDVQGAHQLTSELLSLAGAHLAEEGVGVSPTDTRGSSKERLGQIASELESYLFGIRFQLDAQRYDVYNVVSQVHPQLLADTGRPRFEHRSLVSLVTDILPSYERAAKEEGLDIRLDLQEAYDCPRFEIEVYSLQRALHNILTNAVKYSYRSIAQKRRYIKVWIKCTDHSLGSWGIFVQNYGVGILGEEGGQVFLPGFRGRLAVAEHRSGCGLGLAEAKKCIDFHGGTIRVTSDPASDDPHWCGEHGAKAVYVTTVRMIFPRHTNASQRVINGQAHTVDR
jgi:signal transduction histidine kinase